MTNTTGASWGRSQGGANNAAKMHPGVTVVGPATISIEAEVSGSSFLCGAFSMSGGIITGCAEVFCEDQLPTEVDVHTSDHAFSLDGITVLRTLSGAWTSRAIPEDLKEYVSLRTSRWHSTHAASFHEQAPAQEPRWTPPAFPLPGHVRTLGERRQFRGRTLHRVVAVRDLPHANITAGTVGGWVEHLSCLQDDSWVGDDAIVMDAATLWHQAIVDDHAVVCGGADIAGDSHIGGDIQVGGWADIPYAARCFAQKDLFHLTNVPVDSSFADAGALTVYRTDTGIAVNLDGWVTSALRHTADALLIQAEECYRPELHALFRALTHRFPERAPHAQTGPTH